jgi:hypothetical protein
MFDFLLGLLAVANGDQSLDTKKIDRNIETLKKHRWFKELFDDERYHRLFFVNRLIESI